MQMAAEVRRVGKRYSCRASSRFSAYAGFDRDRLMSRRLLNVVHQRESSVKATTVQATMARMSSSLAATQTQPPHADGGRCRPHMFWGMQILPRVVGWPGFSGPPFLVSNVATDGGRHAAD